MLHRTEARHLLSTKAPLSEEQQMIVQLIDEGYPVESVAERLGEPLDAIKDIISNPDYKKNKRPMGIVEEFGDAMAG